MDIIASQPASAAPPTGGTAVKSISPGLRCYSKNAASQHNNVADPPAREKAARFEREVMPHREPLYLHALRMCHNHADAEDLVQDTMVKAYSNFDSFLPGSNFKAWLNRIQTNTYINTYRRRGRRPVQYSTDTITDQELAGQAQRTSTQHVSAEDQALAALPDTEVMAAMQSLPEQFRAVVYYADVEGFRYREIADIMGTPHGTVTSRLHRGRQHLRRLLGDAAHPGRRRSGRQCVIRLDARRFGDEVAQCFNLAKLKRALSLIIDGRFRPIAQWPAAFTIACSAMPFSLCCLQRSR
jgi:RNA polymerase sigma-70 factor, ECF subfamily